MQETAMKNARSNRSTLSAQWRSSITSRDRSPLPTLSVSETLQSFLAVACSLTLGAALISKALAAEFVPVTPDFPPTFSTAAAWADYDNDGDLDLILCGADGASSHVDLWRNDGAVFTKVDVGLPQTYGAVPTWGDYDNDGRLDLALIFSSVLQLWHNDGASFHLASSWPLSQSYPQAAWVDIDGDGDLDLIISVEGPRIYPPVLHLLRNERGSFTDNNLGIPAEHFAMGDYNGDGFPDVATEAAAVNRLWRNDGISFADSGLSFSSMVSYVFDWIDFDRDGALDLALVGSDTAWPAYDFALQWSHNNGSSFTPHSVALPPATLDGFAWADYDNDGDYDLSAAMFSNDGRIGILRNDGGALNDSLLSFGTGFNAGAWWADFDNDGRLDLLLSSRTVDSQTVRLWRNQAAAANQLPSAPAGLAAQVDAMGVVLTWDPAHDVETPNVILSYDLRVGTAPGGADILNSPSDLTSGYRRLPAVGRYRQPGARLVLPVGTYYWSVQAIDSVMAGGPFSVESTFTVMAPLAGVKTLPAEGLQPLAATLAGEIDPRGLPNAVWFEWGLTASYGQRTPVQNVDGLGWRIAHALLEGLQIGTLYHYRLVAQGTGGTAFGTDQTFTAPRFVPGQTIASSRTPSAWGDYDGDGMLDVYFNGQLWHNDHGTFTNAPVLLPSLYAAAWGDYDADGTLDLAMSGWDGGAYLTCIERGKNGNLFNSGVALPGADGWVVDWGDFDNDGDLDLVITGNAFSGQKIQIWRNDHGTFVLVPTRFPILNNPQASWADYDGDGDLDLLINGWTAGTPVTRICRNDQGVFTVIDVGLPGLNVGTAAWGDFDNDGDLDLAITGSTPWGQASLLWRNDGGHFTPVLPATPDLQDAKAAWGDFDNDGDLDLVVTCSGSDSYTPTLYRNDSGTFVALDSGLAGYGPCAWADADNDGDLDLLIGGQLWMNQGSRVNHPPSAPTNLQATVQPDRVNLKWNSATDLETPSPGLSYNLRVGTSPGAADVAPPLADLATGVRRVAQRGTHQGTNAWLDLLNLPVGTYYWRVQAVDSAFAGGPFSNESSFTVPVGAPAVVTDSPEPIAPTHAVLSGRVNTKGLSTQVWFEFGATTGYGQSTAIQSAPPGLPAFFKETNVGGLNPMTTYHCRAAARNSAGTSYGPDRVFTTPQFTKWPSSLPQDATAAAWGDYDNDGDLDVAVATRYGPVRIFRNDGGVFTDIQAGLPTFGSGSLAWGDYDNDGDLDLLLVASVNWSPSVQIWRNDGGAFHSANLPEADFYQGAWVDLNNDGALDLLLSNPASPAGPAFQIWMNHQGQFDPVPTNLPEQFDAMVLPLDYDLDGDVDLLIAEKYTGVIKIWANDGTGHFADSGLTFPSMFNPTISVEDYDVDGKPDLIISGQLWRNQGGTFVLTPITLPAAASGLWGDFDNDGLPDILVPTEGINIPAPYLLHNTGNGTFAERDLGLRYSGGAPISFGDADGDADLDVLVGGQLWRNDVPAVNTPPTAPSGLRATVAGTRVDFAWDPAADAQTPAPGLSYNVRVGTAPGTANVLAPASNLVTGHRSLPQPGNAPSALHTFLYLPVGTYYWSVQAIDSSVVGGPWAPEKILVVFPDSDGDGMPDDWEVAHGLNPNVPNDPALDSDGDGQSDLAEFLAGTDPRNPDSALSITQIEFAGAQTLVSFRSGASRVYRLDKSLVSPDGPWTHVSDDIAGTGGEVSVTVSPEHTGDQVFYRVCVRR